MKRLIVPAIALGLAIAFAQPASADHLFGGHRCNSGCPSACPKATCEPKCKTSCLPKLDLHRCCPKPACKPACPKPCAPACPKPCDPCDRGHHLGSKLKDCFGKLCHRDKCCDPCGAPAAEAAPAASAFDYNQGPRLSPTPANSTTSTRTTRRTTGF